MLCILIQDAWEFKWIRFRVDFRTMQYVPGGRIASRIGGTKG